MGYVIIAATPVVSVGPTAPTAPGAPTFTSITPIGATASWTAATDAVGVTGYEIKVGAGAWTGVGNVLTYSITGLAASNTYSVSVRAYNAAAMRGPSATSSLTTMSGKTYPLIAMMAQGTLNNRTQASANRMAKTHMCVISFYVGMGRTSFNGSDGAFIDYVHAQSQIGTKIGRYRILDTYMDALFTDKTNIVTSNNWQVYKVGTSGAICPNYFDNTWGVVNLSTYVPSVNGMKAADTIMKMYLDYMVDGTQGGTYQATDKAPNEDIFYWDTFACRIPVGGKTSVNPTYAADINRDGVSDYQSQVGPPSGTDLDQAWRNGMALGLNYLRTRKPNMKFIGNMSGWGNAGTTNGINYINMATEPVGLSGLAKGGFMESQMGLSYSPETWGGFSTNKTMYQYCMQWSDQSTQDVWMHHCNLAGYDYVQTSGAAWQCTRYAICTTLMDNGYHCESNAKTGSTDYYSDAGNWCWLDEYTADVDPASPTFMQFKTEANSNASHYGYLGSFTTGPWPAPLSGLGAGSGNGLYVRFTQNSRGQKFAVILNPRGNGSQTLNWTAKYGTHLNKFLGVLETTVNNGATGLSSITLQDRDGLIAMVVP